MQLKSELILFLTPIQLQTHIFMALEASTEFSSTENKKLHPRRKFTIVWIVMCSEESKVVFDVSHSRSSHNAIRDFVTAHIKSTVTITSRKETRNLCLISPLHLGNSKKLPNDNDQVFFCNSWLITPTSKTLYLPLTTKPNCFCPMAINEQLNHPYPNSMAPNPVSPGHPNAHPPQQPLLRTPTRHIPVP